MAEERLVNIRTVMSRLMRHPMLRGVTLDALVDYTIDFMRLVGVPRMFQEQTVELCVRKYRAELPCDFYKMIQVRDPKSRLCYRYAGDSFFTSEHKPVIGRYGTGLTYRVQNNILTASIEEGKIEVAYLSIPVDKEDGFPLIPDNSSFTKALENYIKVQWFTILFDMGKLSQASLQNAQQEYAFAVGDCETDFNRLDLDKAESFYNSWRTMLIRDTEHRSGFVATGEKEYLTMGKFYGRQTAGSLGRGKADPCCPERSTMPENPYPGKYPTKEKLYFENVALEVNNNMHLVGSGPDNIMPYLKVDNNGHLIFNNN